MIKTFYLLSIMLVNLYAGASQRLDPHEKESADLRNYKIHSRSNCLACHKVVGQKIENLADIDERCVSCHNPLPHSGTIEHMGKDLSKLKIGLEGKITCMSCHRPHRALLDPPKKIKPPISSVSRKSSFVMQERRTTNLPKGLEERKTANPMLRRDCLDCHNMENMP